ncbi:MAG TPA: OmpA family protein [Terriglobia bacterium]|nr:OmpA family protein [Terriglobia bacterium]
MNATKSVRLAAVGLSPLLFLATGCVATRRFVRNTQAPLDARINTVDQKVDQKTSQNASDISELDKKTEAGISRAQSSADQAGQAANQADQHAQAANQTAEQGLSAANQAQNMVNNIDNYQATQHTVVLFRLNKSELTAADKQHLDEVAQTVGSLKHYVIEVQGYTDRTGPKQYNLALSQQRANAVIRYLTMDHNIPLVRIYSLGYGEAAPIASNSSREGRGKNRRVEITVMVPHMTAEAQSAEM